MITGADFDKSFNAKVKNFEMKPSKYFGTLKSILKRSKIVERFSKK